MSFSKSFSLNTEERTQHDFLAVLDRCIALPQQFLYGFSAIFPFFEGKNGLPPGQYNTTASLQDPSRLACTFYSCALCQISINCLQNHKFFHALTDKQESQFVFRGYSCLDEASPSVHQCPLHTNYGIYRALRAGNRDDFVRKFRSLSLHAR